MAALMVAASACALVPASSAEAQDDTTPVSAVIVTARKMPEAVLSTPVVVTVLRRRDLERRQVNDLRDVASLVPGLTLAQFGPGFGTQVSLRGMGVVALDPAADQPVGLVIDGLQLSQGVAFANGLFDVDQIEALKGPQPLFYGKANTAGVISIRTADPTDRAELIARTGHDFEADAWRSELIASGPVARNLRLRLAGLYTTQRGYFSNPATGLAASGARDPASRYLYPSAGYQVRGTALWDPTDRFDARLKLNLSHSRTLYAGAPQYVLCPGGVGALPGLPPFIGGGEDCRLDRTHRLVGFNPAAFPQIEGGGTPFFQATEAFGSLGLNYRLRPDLTLTSVTGYYDLHSRGVANTLDSTFAAPEFGVNVHFRLASFSQEVRLTSDFSRGPNFTLGGYYETGSLENLVGFAGNRALGLPPLLAKGAQDLRATTYSVFGQARWVIARRLELGLGARWENDRRSDVATDLASGAPVYVPLARPVVQSAKISPEATLSYKLGENALLFAALKQGHKPGSFSVTFPASPGQDTAFGGEAAQGGEAGLKARLFQGHLAMDLAAYDYRYAGLQVPTTTLSALGLPQGRTLNAAAADVSGVEFDVVFQPATIAGLSLRAAGNWNNARYKTFANAPCYTGQTIAQGCNRLFSPATGLFTAQDLSKTPLPRAPRWQVNFGFDYERPIGRGLTLVLSNDQHYSTKYGDAVFGYDQSAFIKTDLSLLLRGPQDRWELAFIGKDLADTLTTGFCRNANGAAGAFGRGIIAGGPVPGPAGPAPVVCSVDRGRELWLRLTLHPHT
ncbi:MAG: TonB-dependent receptor [Caulobacteraceae bacterium]|nr:TonB-dependent receptor [Caulobacteraceae bacterium]